MISVTFTPFPRSATRMPEGPGKLGIFPPYLARAKTLCLLVLWWGPKSGYKAIPKDFQAI